jgi:hypothetical protein
MHLDDIFAMVLVNALPDSEFQFMKDKLYSEDLKGTFPKFSEVLQAMKTYDLNKQKAEIRTDPAPPGPTVLATLAPAAPPPLTCVTCQRQFPKVIQRTTGLPFKICQTCTSYP